MFKKEIESRISLWIELRKNLDLAEHPLQDVWDFWNASPFTPYNKNIDPYYPKSWPSPWEIIAENIYDDFTKALMIAWTLKLTEKFKNSKIEIKSMLDETQNRQYNLIFVDNNWILNFDDNGPISITDHIASLKLENIIEITRPR